jgi:hypothetical protein
MKRSAIIAAGLVAVALALAWTFMRSTPIPQAQAATTGPKIVRANVFIVEDESGRGRAALTTNKAGTALLLLGEDGRSRARLVVTNDGAELSLDDEKDVMRIRMYVRGAGPLLQMYDDKGMPRAAIGVVKDGAMCWFFDAKGQGRAVLGIGNGPEGAALTLADENGGARAILAIDEDTPGLYLFDKDGRALPRAEETAALVRPPVAPDRSPPAAIPSRGIPTWKHESNLDFPRIGPEPKQKAAPKPHLCRYCQGTGRWGRCSACNGTGRSGHGSDCLVCDGTGIENCPHCKGTGHTP